MDDRYVDELKSDMRKAQVDMVTDAILSELLHPCDCPDVSDTSRECHLDHRGLWVCDGCAGYIDDLGTIKEVLDRHGI